MSWLQDVDDKFDKLKVNYFCCGGRCSLFVLNRTDQVVNEFQMSIHRSGITL